MKVEKISDLEYRIHYTKDETSCNRSVLQKMMDDDITSIMESKEVKDAIIKYNLAGNEYSAIFNGTDNTLYLVVACPEVDKFCLHGFFVATNLIRYSANLDDYEKECIEEIITAVSDDRSELIRDYIEDLINEQKYGLYLALSVLGSEAEIIDLIESIDASFIEKKRLDEIKKFFTEHMLNLSGYIQANTLALHKGLPLVHKNANDVCPSVKNNKGNLYFTSDIDALLGAAKVLPVEAAVYKDDKGYWIFGELNKSVYDTELQQVLSTDADFKMAYLTEHKAKSLGTLKSLSKI